MQKRNIGAELAARMKHLNEMLANGESVEAISRADVDSPQAVEMPHMMTVAREWLAAENKRMAQAGETAHCGSLAHIVGWLLAEVQRLRHVVCDRISELGEEMERTPQPHATPGEGTSQGRCTLTADEREAIVEGLFAIERQLEGPLRGDLGWYARDQRQAAATLRELLARLG